jgi:hypothetical protein
MQQPPESRGIQSRTRKATSISVAQEVDISLGKEVGGMIALSRLQAVRTRAAEIRYSFTWTEGLFWAAIGSLPGTVLAVIAAFASGSFWFSVIALALLLATIFGGVVAYVARKQSGTNAETSCRHVVEDLDLMIAPHLPPKP